MTTVRTRPVSGTVTGMTRLLTDLMPFIYGTTRLGDASVPRAQRIAVAKSAVERGLWLHTSRQYDEALEVLGEVFDDTSIAAPLIMKIGGGTASDIRATVAECIQPLGTDTIAIGQLSPVGALEAALLEGGPALDDLRALQTDGLIGRFVLEIFPWTSSAPLEALRRGHLDGLVDGFITYYNPLQRFMSNALWAEVTERDLSIISMRTVAGAPVHDLRDVPGAAWKPYLQARAVEVAPIFEASGISTWAEFCMRFAHSHPQVVSTVGSTSRVANLDELVEHSLDPEPLPSDILDEIAALQHRWSDETDIHAEVWTM
jgi:aryl-alcohol dehydrogenase-like predicted oxidoreductase